MELVAEKRTELGKKSKKLARSKKLPAVVYGKGMDSIPLTISYQTFEKVFNEAGETSIVDILVEQKPLKALISEVYFHPVTGKIVHASFKRVNLKEKIKAKIPLKIVGESPIVKDGTGLLLMLLDEIEVESYPTDLPHDIKVDVSGLTEIDQGIAVSDLPIDTAKVTVVDQEPEDLVVKIDYAEMKEEEVATPASEAELIAKVETTEQLTEEEKAKREAEDKAKKEKE